MFSFRNTHACENPRRRSMNRLGLWDSQESELWVLYNEAQSDSQAAARQPSTLSFQVTAQNKLIHLIKVRFPLWASIQHFIASVSDATDVALCQPVAFTCCKLLQHANYILALPLTLALKKEMKSASAEIGIKSKCVPGHIAWWYKIATNWQSLACTNRYRHTCIHAYLPHCIQLYRCMQGGSPSTTFMLHGCSIIKNLIFMWHLAVWPKGAWCRRTTFALTHTHTQRIVASIRTFWCRVVYGTGIVNWQAFTAVSVAALSAKKS